VKRRSEAEAPLLIALVVATIVQIVGSVMLVLSL
jgi:hypothetical protein